MLECLRAGWTRERSCLGAHKRALHPSRAYVDAARRWPVLSYLSVRPPMWPSQQLPHLVLPQLRCALEIPLCIVTPGPSAGGAPGWFSCFIKELPARCPVSFVPPSSKVPLVWFFKWLPGTVDTKLRHRKRDS